MANRRFVQFFNTLHKMPVLLDCNFIVDSTNANGLGVRSLKGPGIQNVYMNTVPAAVTTTSVFASGVASVVVADASNLYVGQTVTDSTTGGNLTSGTKVLSINGTTIGLSKVTAGASAVSPGDTLSFVFTTSAPGNPNPAAGFAVIQLQDNYNRYYGGFSGFIPATNTAISSGITIGDIVVIATLGSSTLAQWQTAGLPVGITPVVGAAFVALATSVAGGGTVATSKPAFVTDVVVIGDPNQTLTSSAANVPGSSSGAYLCVKFQGPKTNSFTASTHTSTALDTISTSTNGIQVGDAISGAGIPLGTTVAAIVSSTALTLSAAATATASAVPITVQTTGVLTPVDNTVISLAMYLGNSSILVQGE